MNGNREEQQPDGTHELELVERIRAGDQDALREFIVNYQKKLFRYAYGFLRNREDALEIMQETFIRFHEKLGTWRSDSSLSAWIYRIAHNLCIDHYRKHHLKQAQTDPLEGVPEKRVQPLWPESGAEARKPLLSLVQQSLHRLSGRQKTVFLLRHQEGKKLEEIAAILGTSLGTIKTLHHRAIRKLRRDLRPLLAGGSHEAL